MDRLNRCLPIVLGAMLCLCASQTLAQAEGDDSSDQVARGLFQAGRASYDAGKYEDALKYFQQAYDLSQRPGLLYNIGQASDRVHDDRRTIEVFRLYLERVPDADNRAEVEGRLRSLERIVELEDAEARQQQAATDASASNQVQIVPTSTRAESAGDGPGLAPWLVIGGGGAVLVTGVVLTVIGTGQISDVENAERSSAWADVSDKADSGPVLATTGVVLMSLGAVGAAAGVVWLLSADDDAPVQMVVGPGSITLRGSL